MLDYKVTAEKFSGFKNLFLKLQEALRRGDDIKKYL